MSEADSVARRESVETEATVDMESEPSPTKVADHADTSEEDEGPVGGLHYVQPTNIDKIVHNQFTTAIKKKGSLDNFTEDQLAKCLFLVSVFFHD